ncbi:MAG: DUF4296 domain-containing protein [Bacteroidota bacterium]
MGKSGTSFLLSILMMVLLLAACSSKAPSGVLDKDQMAELLTEFYLKEARMKAGNVTVDSAVLLFTRLRGQYAGSHGFPDSVIDASFEHYLNHPVEMDQVFDRVIDSLSLREQRLGTADGTPEP